MVRFCKNFFNFFLDIIKKIWLIALAAYKTPNSDLTNDVYLLRLSSYMHLTLKDDSSGFPQKFGEFR